MSYTSVDKENGFMGPGVYYQCSDTKDIKDVFTFLGLNSVMFSGGAKLSEEECDGESVGIAITNRFDGDYALFDDPMSGKEIAGALTVMLILEQQPDILNDLHSATSIDRYIDHSQIEPITKSFEMTHHYNKGDHTVYIRRILKPKQDTVVG